MNWTNQYILTCSKNQVIDVGMSCYSSRRKVTEGGPTLSVLTSDIFFAFIPVFLSDAAIDLVLDVLLQML